MYQPSARMRELSIDDRELITHQSSFSHFLAIERERYCHLTLLALDRPIYKSVKLNKQRENFR